MPSVILMHVINNWGACRALQEISDRNQFGVVEVITISLKRASSSEDRPLEQDALESTVYLRQRLDVNAVNRFGVCVRRHQMRMVARFL